MDLEIGSFERNIEDLELIGNRLRSLIESSYIIHEDEELFVKRLIIEVPEFPCIIFPAWIHPPTFKAV